MVRKTGTPSVEFDKHEEGGFSPSGFTPVRRIQGSENGVVWTGIVGTYVREE